MIKKYFFTDFTYQPKKDLNVNLEDIVFSLLPNGLTYAVTSLQKSNNHTYLYVQIRESEFDLIKDIDLSEKGLTKVLSYNQITCAYEVTDRKLLGEYIDYFGVDFFRIEKNEINTYEVSIKAMTIQFKLPSKNVANWANNL